MRALGLIGPLAGWELRRLVRRGAALRVWFLLLYTFLLVFVIYAAVWCYPQPVRDVFTRSLTPGEAAAFAHRFTLVLLEAQLVAVVALTPALAASAVSEEKDRHTLPLLLTTQLTDREIVFGKAVGRLAFMMTVVTSGLPVLALALLFGRVPLDFLLTGYGLTLGTALLCAALGMEAACRAPDFRSALLRAYGRTAVLVCGCFVPPLVLASPFGILETAHRLGGNFLLVAGCGYPIGQALVGVFLLASAARALRLREPGAGPPPVTAYPEPPRPAEPPLLLPESTPRPDLPPLSGDPVLWKERCTAWHPAWGLPTMGKVLAATATGLAAVLFVAGALVVVKRVNLALQPEQAEQVGNRPGAQDLGGWLLVGAGVFAAGRYLLPLAVGLSGAIAGERFRRTLDVLLSTPLDRRAVLRAKVQAAAERGTAFAAVAVAAVGMAFTADGGARLGAVAGARLGGAAALLVLSGFGLVIGAGAWLSVRCPTDARAFRLLLPVAVLAIGWPIGVWNLLAEDVSPDVLLRTMLVATAVTATAALVLWWLAGRALERGE